MNRIATKRRGIRVLNLILLATAVWSGQVAAESASPKSAEVTSVKSAASTALPGDSVYQVAATMVDQDGRAFKLAERRGQPMLISMFYNSCQFVCPMLIDTLRNTEQQLTAE